MSKASTLSKQDWSLLAGIVALGLMLRVTCAILLASPLVSDYLVYWQLANNLHSGVGLIDDYGKLTAFMNLGYPIFLSAVFEFFGPSIFAVKSSNIILASASMVFLFLATQRLFGSVKISAISTLIFAIYLEGIVYTNYAAKENLMMLLMIIQLWIASDTNIIRNRWINPATFGLTLGLTAMVGNAALSLIPGLFVLIYLRIRNIYSTLRYFAIALIVAIITLTPLLVRNHGVFGSYVLNNNGGFNLYIGNNPNSTPFFISITETPLGPQWQELRTNLGERQVDVLLRQTALEYIINNPGTTAINMAKKAIAFWWPPIHTGEGEERPIDRIVRLLWLIQFSLVCILFVASAAWLKNRAEFLGPIWLIVAGYTAIHMIFYVVYRYRLPIMPFVFIGAAFSISEAMSWYRNRFAARHLASPQSRFGNDTPMTAKQME